MLGKKILVLCLLALSVVTAIDIPIIVTILNAEPEILSVSVPPSIPIGIPFQVTALVRDNNTLADIRNITGYADGVKVMSVTPPSNLSQGSGTYTLTFLLPATTKLICDGTVTVSDEAVQVSSSFSSPFATYYEITKVTDRITVSLKPGQSTATNCVVHILSNIDTWLKASTDAPSTIKVKVNGSPIGSELVTVGYFVPMNADLSLPIEVSLIGAMPDLPNQLNINLILILSG